MLDWLIIRENEPKRKFKCDTDVGLVHPEESAERYLSDQVFDQWRRLFGRSAKTGEPKGIIVLDLSGVPV